MLTYFQKIFWYFWCWLKGRGPKVREDELDSPMRHLRKRAPPTWAGVPQFSFMAQAIDCYFLYYEHIQLGRYKFQPSHPMMELLKRQYPSQSIAKSRYAFLYFYSVSTTACIFISFLAFYANQQRVVFPFFSCFLTSFLFVSLKGWEIAGAIRTI